MSLKVCICCDVEWPILNKEGCCLYCFNKYVSTDFKVCPVCLKETDPRYFLEEEDCCVPCQNKTNDKFCISCEHNTVPSNFIDVDHMCKQCCARSSPTVVSSSAAASSAVLSKGLQN